MIPLHSYQYRPLGEHAWIVEREDSVAIIVVNSELSDREQRRARREARAYLSGRKLPMWIPVPILAGIEALRHAATQHKGAILVGAASAVGGAALAVLILQTPEYDPQPPVARPAVPTATVIETPSTTPRATPTREEPTEPITVSNNAPPTPVPPVDPGEEPPATPEPPSEPEPTRTPDPEPSPSPEPPDPSEEPEPPDPEPVAPQCDGIGLDVEVPPLLDIDACLL